MGPAIRPFSIVPVSGTSAAVHPSGSGAQCQAQWARVLPAKVCKPVASTLKQNSPLPSGICPCRSFHELLCRVTRAWRSSAPFVAVSAGRGAHNSGTRVRRNVRFRIQTQGSPLHTSSKASRHHDSFGRNRTRRQSPKRHSCIRSFWNYSLSRLSQTVLVGIRIERAFKPVSHRTSSASNHNTPVSMDHHFGFGDRAMQ